MVNPLSDAIASALKDAPEQSLLPDGGWRHWRFFFHGEHPRKINFCGVQGGALIFSQGEWSRDCWERARKQVSSLGGPQAVFASTKFACLVRSTTADELIRTGLRSAVDRLEVVIHDGGVIALVPTKTVCFNNVL